MIFYESVKKNALLIQSQLLIVKGEKMKFDFGVLWNKGQNFKNISIGFDPLLELQY
jgi:hypothetical protein